MTGFVLALDLGAETDGANSSGAETAASSDRCFFVGGSSFTESSESEVDELLELESFAMVDIGFKRIDTVSWCGYCTNISTS